MSGERIAAHLTWWCVNQCRECWARATVYDRPEVLHAPERSVDEWLRAIERQQPRTMDWLGGEPFLVEGLYRLVAGAGVPQGISTNGMLWEAIAAFCEQPRVAQLVSITVSYHPDANEHIARYNWRWRRSLGAFVTAGYPVSVNLVDYPGYRKRAADMLAWLRTTDVVVHVNPYERTAHLGQAREEGLVCGGGERHLLISPDGLAYPCFTSFRSPYWRDYCLGNWIDARLDLRHKPVPCYLDCVDYYVLPHEHEAGDVWDVRVRKWQP